MSEGHPQKKKILLSNYLIGLGDFDQDEVPLCLRDPPESLS